MKLLQQKIIISIMIIVSVIIIAFIGSINILPRLQNQVVAQKLLTETATYFTDSKTTPPPQKPDANSDSTQHETSENTSDKKKTPPSKTKNIFASSTITALKTNAEGHSIEFLSDTADDQKAKFEETITQLIDTPTKSFGVIQHTYYYHVKTNGHHLFLFLDGSALFINANQTLFWSILAGISTWIICLIISLLTVGKLTEPLETAMLKQHRFIANAEHEMKTPISVILANTDVLENEIGENKWLSYIKDEARQLGSLAHDLLSISSLDQLDLQSKFTEVNLSEIVKEAILPFEAVIFESQKRLSVDISPDSIIMNGDEQLLSQLVSILLKNAIQYGNDGGEIEINLHIENKKAILSVSNTGRGIKTEELPLIFERFYRCTENDEPKTVGHGLGLSIAAEIIDAHQGTVSVESELDEWTRFYIAFPLN